MKTPPDTAARASRHHAATARPILVPGIVAVLAVPTLHVP